MKKNTYIYNWSIQKKGRKMLELFENWGCNFYNILIYVDLYTYIKSITYISLANIKIRMLVWLGLLFVESVYD